MVNLSEYPQWSHKWLEKQYKKNSPPLDELEKIKILFAWVDKNMQSMIYLLTFSTWKMALDGYEKLKSSGNLG